MRATMRRANLELRLSVVPPDGQPIDLVVEAAPDAPARVLLDRIGEATGLDLSDARVRGEPVLPDAPVSELLLQWGDALVVDGAGSSAAPPPAELVVEGGPEAGRRIALTNGPNRIGRDAAIAIDDPALSSEHLVVNVAADGAVTVEDAGSRNGTLVDGVSVVGARALGPEELVHAGRSLFRVAAPSADAVPAGGSDGLVALNRPPRSRAAVEPRPFPIPEPPSTPQRARLPLGASLIPLALGIGLYLFTHLPTMLFFSLLSPVMAVSTWMEDRRSGRKGFEQRSREYRQRLAEVQEQLESERAAELVARRAESPSAPELLAWARRRDARLWERRPGDTDFLALRIGSADGRARLQPSLGSGGDDGLRRAAQELVDWYAVAPDVPTTVPFAEAAACGVCGPRESTDRLARWLVAQAAALHSPRELVIAAAVAEEDAAAWDWLKWLPHSDGAAGAPTRRLGTGPAGARSVCEEVARLVQGRRADSEAGGGAARRRIPHVLLVVDERVVPERSLMAEILAGSDAGCTVLWLARERRDLPGESVFVIELDEASSRAALTDTRTGAETEVDADGLPEGWARSLARALAPLRDAGGGANAGVPQRLGLLDALGADDPDADWLLERWDGAEGIGAVIGAAAGEQLRIDLRRDGPHGLVAGTTGAGKSELLRTLIASLAASAPPTRLAFLLVDYKGGTAFEDCVRLPHTVGLVTDLDAHLTRRALQSLNAELQRRERILHDSGARDLAELERRSPQQAPPSLLIVIDEFATLAKEVPDFIEGVVDVAQRGRSLGVHLLLATQRPGGVVSENIRANTNLRIALRVNEPAESSDVIAAPDAARIARDLPGRAYARTGHGELTEFQAAYSGAATVHATSDEPVVVRPFTLDGARQAQAPAGEEERSDLARLVDAAVEAAAARDLERMPSPWLDPLPASLPLEQLDGAVGLLDEPERQLQRPLVVDLEADGSVLVYGTSGSGKTTFLRTLALSLARDASADELHVYGLDFATRALAPLEALPHVGAVVGGEDQERVERLFALLRRTLDRRKALFASHGVFSLADYARLPDAQPEPRILVLLDGYAGFAQAFERVNMGELVDLLPRLVADGRPLGLHFAISADRRGAVPNALAGIIPAKLVLRMADEDEFAALGVDPRAVRGAQLPPGRGFLPGGSEFHLADTDLPATIAALAARATGTPAPAIEPLPPQVERAGIEAPREPWHAALGLSDAELLPAHVDLSDRHFLVVGPYRSGRSTALATIVRSLAESTPGVEVHLLAPRRSPLAELDLWTSVATGASCDEACDRLALELTGDRPALVVVDDGEELAETLGAPALETLVRRGRDGSVRVVAAVERQGAQRAFSGWVRELRKEEHGLLLVPDPDVDGDLLGTRLPRRSNPVYPAGRGYLVERGSLELVQVAS